MTNAVEFLQIPTRYLDDDVVQARLEAGTSYLRHAILDLIKRDTKTQLCGDESQWISSSFRGQCRRP